ncbi:MAG TPA: choice-of-anchor D domain-containing protein, partial [Rhodanobacteraceae bacterium]|nr:choice-of-anchor D domain-containing protein [Rhodanobacteraceae bacterium]
SAVTAKVNGDLLNSGYITVAGSNSGAMATVTVDGNASNSGSYGDVYIDAYGKLAVSGADGYRQTGGTTTVRTNGVLTSGHNDFVGGMLEGDGTVAGFTTIGSGATLSGGYGHTPGTLTINGGLRIDSGATVASYQSDAGNTEITVSPDSTLELTGGTIQGNASGSLTYTPGQTFTVMNFAPGSLSGVFDGVQNGTGTVTPGTGTDLGEGRTLGVVYNNTAGNIQLQVVSTPGTTAEIWNGGTGNWTTAGGWSSNAAPMFYSDVTIGNTASGHVTLGQDATIESLLIKSGNTLSISGVATTTLSVGGDVTVNAGGTLNMPVGQLALGGNFSNSGTTTLGGKQLYALGSITNSGSGSLNVGTSAIHSHGMSNGAGATITIAGGVITPSSFANAGSLSGFGTIASSIGNTGSVAAGGGTLTVQGGIQGSGDITIGSGARLDLGQATTGSSAAALTLASTGSLNLGSQNFTVSNDYSNANFGTGNSFNKLANVSGTGRVAATGNVAQAITGSGVSNGGSASPTLAFGNVHVGSSNDQNYAIANTGSSGPALRGAIQTSVNGGSLTDASLSGSGVTAANWGPVSTGASTSSYTVTYAPTVAGALTGQAVHIANNFSNVGEQTLAITGAAYAYASPTVASSLSPQYNFGVVQVGQTYTDSLTIKNTLVASNAAYQEGLNASFGSSTNSQLTGSGSITNLGAGQSNAGTMMVTLTPVTAGAIGGSIAVNFASNGAGTSGLGITALDPQNLNYAWAFGGTVVNQANPDITPNPVTLASRVGGVATQALAVQNVAGPPPQASLDAQIGTVSGAFTSNNASSINQLLAGHTDNTSFVVGLDTATAGHQIGSAQINLQSDSTPNGCTSDCIVNLSPQTIQLSGNVYTPAQATVDTASPVDFGIVHVGDGGGTLSRAISVTNGAPVTALNDTLLGGITTGGSPAFHGNGTLGSGGLGAGQSSTAMAVTLGTATAGAYSGSANLAFASHDGELADLVLAGADLGLSAQVNNYAALAFSFGSGLGSLSYDPDTSTYTLNLGNIAQDAYSGLTSTTLAFVNSGGAAAFTDLLSSTVAIVSGSGFSLSGGSVSGLAGGVSQGGFEIGLGTLNAGFFNELLSFNVNSSNSSGFDMNIGTLYLDLRGSVGATATVPEPGNLAMFVLGLGLLGFFGLAMRRKNSAGGDR